MLPEQYQLAKVYKLIDNGEYEGHITFLDQCLSALCDLQYWPKVEVLNGVHTCAIDIEGVLYYFAEDDYVPRTKEELLAVH